MCANADIEIESTRRRKQKTSNQPSCLGKKYLPAANADGGWERIFVKFCIHDKLNLEYEMTNIDWIARTPLGSGIQKSERQYTNGKKEMLSNY